MSALLVLYLAVAAALFLWLGNDPEDAAFDWRDHLAAARFAICWGPLLLYVALRLAAFRIEAWRSRGDRRLLAALDRPLTGLQIVRAGGAGLTDVYPRLRRLVEAGEVEVVYDREPRQVFRRVGR